MLKATRIPSCFMLLSRKKRNNNGRLVVFFLQLTPSSSSPPPPELLSRLRRSCSTASEDASTSILDDWLKRIRDGRLRGGDAGQEQAARKLRRLQRTLERLQWDNAIVQKYCEDQQQEHLRVQQCAQSHHQHQQQQQLEEYSPELMAKPMEAPEHIAHHPRRQAFDADPITQKILDNNKTYHIPSSTSENSFTNQQSPSEQQSKQIQQQPSTQPPSIPRGLYLYGSVGTGKSMLMDRFFELTDVSKKKRYHFHEFMSDLHRRLHAHRRSSTSTQPQPGDQSCQELTTSTGLSTSKLPPETFFSPIQRTARDLANECSLLCLDEFQVLDVADAILLRQVLGHLLLNGTVLVTTSNRPLSYYFERQQRLDQHTHYIATLLQRYCVPHDMETEIDYRQFAVTTNSYESSAANPNDENNNNGPVLPHCMYMVMDNGAQVQDLAMRQRMEQVLQCLLGDDFETTVTPFPLGGRRHVEIICYTSSSQPSSTTSTTSRLVIGEVSFDDLCVHHHLVAADYRLLAERVNGLWVTNLPTSINDSLRGHDVARRWVHCIDSLYEARIPLLCTAGTPLSHLFVSTQLPNRQQSNSNTSDGDADAAEEEEATGELLWADQATSIDGYALGALVSVQDLPMAMRRAASRLAEMTSRQWWKRIVSEARKE